MIGQLQPPSMDQTGVENGALCAHTAGCVGWTVVLAAVQAVV